MTLTEFYLVLSETTEVFRKGPTVTEHQIGTVTVMEVFDMPHEDEAADDLIKIDVVFMVVGVDKVMALRHKEKIVDFLDNFTWSNPLAVGPSYIAVGGDLGSQDAALRLFALGQVLDLWKIVSAKTLGITDEAEIRRLAGSGFLMISGYKSI